MWTSAAVLLALLGVALCRPDLVTPHGNFSTDPLSTEDLEWIENHVATHRTSYPPGFNFMYVSQDGHIAPDRKPAGHYIKIVGSPQVSQHTLYVGALMIHKMMKHVPAHIFNNVANSEGGLGIFTAAEKLTVFPDFASMADTPACHGRCDGSCSHTCTFDGRKYETISGVTSTLALVVEDNVMCTGVDPYHHRDNILVHEFAHMVGKRGMTSSEKSQLNSIYNHAKASRLWDLSTYSMANSAEYFGESTGAFFLVNLQTGGMTDCSYGECRTEMDARRLIQSRDPQLYNFLVQIWTDGNGQQPSGLTVCYNH